MVSVWVAAGIIEPHQPDAGQPYNDTAVAHALVMAALLFGWCKSHAAQNSIKPPRGAPLLVALISPIGLPYYAFRGYGWRKGLRIVGLGLLTFLALVILYVVCFEISARFGA
jgi:hypothetical protein